MGILLVEGADDLVANLPSFIAARSYDEVDRRQVVRRRLGQMFAKSWPVLKLHKVPPIKMPVYSC